MKAMTNCLAAAVLSSIFIGSASHATRSSVSGFDDLSREMSTCAAYFSLLSSIIENSEGPPAKADVAKRIKSNGFLMLTQAIHVANHIGIQDDVVMERVDASLKEMVETVNGDPPNSLRVMHTKYGQPCDQLLENAAERYATLLQRDGHEF